MVVLILFALELVLGLIFDYNDKKRHDRSTQLKIDSGAYANVDSSVIKEIYDELFLLDMQWEPFVHFRLKEFNGKHTTINKNGQRKTVNYAKRQDSLIKIFCLGGSTMLSTGARDEHTIPSELAKFIDQAVPNKNIEITNFGCHGYNRSIENVQLQQELLNGNVPDIVIFYDGVNEVIAAHQNNEAGTPTNAINRKNEFKLSHSYSKKLKLFLVSSNINRFIVYLQRRIFKTTSFEVKLPEKLSKDIADNYIENLQITKALGQQFNFKVFNFLQPVIYTKKNLSETELIAAKASEYYKELYRNSYALTLQDPAIIKDSTFFDISNAFDNETKTIYTDFCHTGEQGNKLVARHIFQVIQSELDESLKQ